MAQEKERLRDKLADKRHQFSVVARSRSFAAADDVNKIAKDATTIPGWVSGQAAREVAARSYMLAGDPVIVEVGVFMGRSTVLLAAPRRRRGSGKVFCVDPFDCSGDEFSVPFYQKELAGTGAASLEDVFRQNLQRRSLEPWVVVLKGGSSNVIVGWTRPIDLLLLDGDHSPSGARAIFDLWSPHVKPGGQIILHNTGSRTYADGHDGNYRIATQQLVAPRYTGCRQIDYTTYATKLF